MPNVAVLFIHQNFISGDRLSFPFRKIIFKLCQASTNRQHQNTDSAQACLYNRQHQPPWSQVAWCTEPMNYKSKGKTVCCFSWVDSEQEQGGLRERWALVLSKWLTSIRHTVDWATLPASQHPTLSVCGDAPHRTQPARLAKRLPKNHFNRRKLSLIWTQVLRTLCPCSRDLAWRKSLQTSRGNSDFSRRNPLQV